MTKESRIEFSNDIKNMRNQLGLRKIECAKYCGVSVNSYGYWESGMSEPKEKNVKIICAFLGLNEEDYE